MQIYNLFKTKNFIFSKHSFYDNVTYVSQDSPIFDGTLRENLILDKKINDEEIITETLLGKTNKYLVSNPQNITKNIYETVDINFYNTITMADENSGITIMNDIGAAKINESISAVLDYQNAQATKARVNFEDGTYHIISIDPTTQITITDNYATYTFTIYAPGNNPVKNVEIISYDETTVYATITGVFPGNAFDKITQQVYIL